MTLLEILVALGIIALATAVTIAGVRKLRSSDLRADAARLAAALRYTFDRALATGAHHRVVLDLDEGMFRVERCEGKVKLTRGIDQSREEQTQEVLAQLEAIKQQVEQSGLDELGAGGAGAANLEQAAQTLGGAQCGPVKGQQGKPKKLRTGRGIELKQVYVTHVEDPVGDGIVTLNFFPSGYAEKAVLILEDGDGDAISILVHPITGQVELKKGEYRKAREFVFEDAAGEEIVEE